ncbi:MAG: indole-3-glycerol phosphate synthase TrpC [Clostridiales bacterium]|jgi:indole-3-glycerol phosphate synthase|nr:indole-3-glycerol phosphate synthase TrpC [Clostridiales bacterium]
MILDTLVQSTLKRVAAEKERAPKKAVAEQALALNSATDFPFERALKRKNISFICEVKRASPSKGIISADFPYVDIAKDYESAGADALSVLTEPEFFKGSDTYLEEISRAVTLPVLRKDFIVDTYQIYRARLLNASAVLLICAVLEDGLLRECLDAAHSLGLSALVEAHDENEIKRGLSAGARIIGVNNRDLRTFSVDLSLSLRLREFVPPETLFVSESGINSRADIERLEANGADAVLIGEALMRAPDRGKYLRVLKGEESL